MVFQRVNTFLTPATLRFYDINMEIQNESEESWNVSTLTVGSSSENDATSLITSGFTLKKSPLFAVTMDATRVFPKVLICRSTLIFMKEFANLFANLVRSNSRPPSFLR
jgi:hypothetical protein